MKIETIEALLVPPRWVFVRMAAGGLVGWGEASLEGHGEAVAGAVEALKDRFLGADASRIEDIWQVAHRGGFYRGGPVLMSALSGLDQALWDINGKALGVPVWRLLGGKVRDRVRVYAWIGGDRPGEVSEAAAARRGQGFGAVKMNACAEMDMLASPKALDAVVERVAAVQAQGMEVGVDFHGRLRRPMARQLAALLQPLRPLFIEEPLLSENLPALRDIRAATTTPIALGERLYSRWDLRPVLEAGIADILQPDLSHAGGISEVRRIAAMAEAYDVAVAPHSPLGPIALAACLQIAACTPNHVLQEMSLGIHYNQGHDLLTYMANPEIFAVRDSFVAVPEGPGLGVELDDAAVRAAAAEPHRWRNPVFRLADGGFAEW